jgi:hypothetical protein
MSIHPELMDPAFAAVDFLPVEAETPVEIDLRKGGMHRIRDSFRNSSAACVGRTTGGWQCRLL